MKMKIYTGIGSRNTPPDILDIMFELAAKLASEGYVLRSGGAQGADDAFEQGAVTGGSPTDIFYAYDATPDAMAMAAKYHPAWGVCNSYAQKLHGRNSFQVLGRDLQTPFSFIVCWTPDGCIAHADRSRKTGGTDTAISIAAEHGIPIFNLQRPEHLDRILKYLAEPRPQKAEESHDTPGMR